MADDDDEKNPYLSDPDLYDDGIDEGTSQMMRMAERLSRRANTLAYFAGKRDAEDAIELMEHTIDQLEDELDNADNIKTKMEWEQEQEEEES